MKQNLWPDPNYSAESGDAPQRGELPGKGALNKIPKKQEMHPTRIHELGVLAGLKELPVSKSGKELILTV